MNRTKQEHYIPNKSYLDYFTDKSISPNSLWVYFDKNVVKTNAEEAKPIPITPLNLCKEAYLYETPNLPVNAVENMLKIIEDDYKKVLDNKIIPNKTLSASDRLAVSMFISTLEMRTPLNKANSDQFITDVKEKVTHLEEVHSKGEKSELHKELDEAERNNLMFLQTLLVAAQMNRYQVGDMLFLSPQFDDEESFFITSDFPVTLLDFAHMNSFYPPTPLDVTAEVTVPLTPKIALFYNHLGLNGYEKIDFNYVREINNRTLYRSNKYVISPKKLSKDFSRYTAKRHPQSFVVFFLSEKLMKQRARRTDTYMKVTAKKVIKSLVKDEIKLKKNGGSVDSVLISPKDQEGYNWFIRALKLFGTISQETDSETIYKLNKALYTNGGMVINVRISKPNQSKMLKQKVETLIRQACGLLYKEMPLLIQNKTHERTIATHIATYLKPLFTGLDVDTEYNREGDQGDPKRDNEGELILPDIIIHKRGSIKGSNLAAIQVKGYWNLENRSKDEQDLKKLMAKYHYLFLFRIELKKDNFEIISVV